MRLLRTLQEHGGRRYAAALRDADLGQGDFVKVDCAACHHVALLTPQALLRGPSDPRAGQHTSIIEPLSLDEAYLDVTENLKAVFQHPIGTPPRM